MSRLWILAMILLFSPACLVTHPWEAPHSGVISERPAASVFPYKVYYQRRCTKTYPTEEDFKHYVQMMLPWYYKNKKEVSWHYEYWSWPTLNTYNFNEISGVVIYWKEK